MDLSILLFLQTMRETLPTIWTTLLGFLSELVVSPVALLYPAFLYWCIDQKVGRFFFMNLMGSTFVNQAIKNTACVYRPWIRDSRLHIAELAQDSATGYSFPSGHTTMAVTEYGSTAYWQKKHPWLIVICIILAILTGFSRLWLGAHTPQDVLVAMIVATILLFANAKILKWLDTHTEYDRRILIGSIVLVVLYLLYVTFKPYPLDYLNGSLLVDPVEMMIDCFEAAGFFLGFIVSWYLDRTVLHYDSHGSKKEKAIRFLSGVVLLMAFEYGILPIGFKWVGVHAYNFLKGFVRFFFILTIHPWLIQKMEARTKTPSTN